MKSAGAHQWQKVGELPVTLERFACGCGCKRMRFQIAAPGGKGLAFDVPAVAGKKATSAELRRVGTAVELGREFWSLWQRLKRAVA